MSSTTKENPLIYQIFTGRLHNANTIDHLGTVLLRMTAMSWSQLSEQGFSHIYLTGLFDTSGPIIVQEENGIQLGEIRRTPSPFAITDHTKVDPRFGTNEELIQLIEAIKAAQLQVIVDFVPNHTGTNHPWLIEHPEYYTGQKEFSGDVIKLNYENPATVAAMTEVLTRLSDFPIDGVRCDMAHLVPLHFWQHAISTIKKQHPHFRFIGEVYPTDVFNLSIYEQFTKVGFDYLYHEPLYRNLSWSSPQVNQNYVAGHLHHILTGLKHIPFLHYLSNHDDEFQQQWRSHAFALFTITATLPGAMLIYNGFLNGKHNRLAHHTVELLSIEESSFQLFPPQFSRFLILRKLIKPRIISIELAGDGAVYAKFTGQLDIRGTLVANLGLNAVEPNVSGMAAGLSPLPLLPGQAELFFEN